MNSRQPLKQNLKQDLRASHFTLGTEKHIEKGKYLDKIGKQGSRKTFVTQNMLQYKWIEPVAVS
jgi:hypothetical protein